MNLEEATIKTLIENKYITGYRTIGEEELYNLCLGETIYGKYNNSSENQNNSNLDNVVCFFIKPISWVDKYHEFMIECEFHIDEVETGNGIYYSSGDINDTLKWTGRRGKTESNVEELYVKSYNLNNVKSFIVKDNLKNPLDYYQSMLDNDKEGLKRYIDTMRSTYKEKVKKWISEEEIVIKNIKTKNIKKL